MKFNIYLLLLSVSTLFSFEAFADYPKGAPFIQNSSKSGFSFSDSTSPPDAYGYVWKDNNEPEVTYNFLDTTYGNGTWTRITGLGDDNFVGPFNIGFQFKYYYYFVQQFWIGSNGYISFDPNPNMASPFPNMPNSLPPNNLISGFGSDLNFNGAGNPGKCYLYQNNSDTLIVSYYNVPFWVSGSPSYTGSNTFQIILSKNDSSITYQYKTQTGLTSNNSITIGIENNTGQIGLQYKYNLYPTANTAIKFIYPSSTSFQVKDVSVNWVDNPASGAVIKVATYGMALNANIANSGNQNVGSFKVVGRVRAFNTTLLMSDTVEISSMNAGTNQNITFNSEFFPASEGTYYLEVQTFLQDDQVANNNSRTLEIAVLRRDTLANEIKYDDGTSGSNISWTGGNGAIANYYVPPFYPVRIESVKFFITANPNNVGFFAKIIDDDGPNGLPGTELFSTSVSAPVLNTFTTVPVNNLMINDGGFYVSWVMNGESISLGEDITAPISRRSFEGFAGTYAPYRNSSTNDPMIRAVIKFDANVGINVVSTEIPEKFELSQNYPNPFNPATSIKFQIAKSELVTLKIFDLAGREIQTLVNEKLEPGIYSLNFKAGSLPSGVYFYRLSAGNYSETKKMVLVK